MLKDKFLLSSGEALRGHDKVTRQIMSNILSELTREEKVAGFQGWTDELEEAVVRRYVKSLQKAIQQMGDCELSNSYKYECDVLMSFLPGFPGEAETRQVVDSFLSSARSLGQFIGSVMKSGHKLDPQIVRKIGQEKGLK